MKSRLPLLFAAIFIIIVAAILTQKGKKEASDVVVIIDQDTPRETITDFHIPPTPGENKHTESKTKDNIVTEKVTTELKEVLKTLPTLDKLKALDAHDVHHTPAVLKESGIIIGSILQKAEVEPTRRKPTLDFLLSCAEGKDYAPAVRAVCWNSLLTHIPQWKIFFPVAKAQVPPAIKSLALKLQ